MLSPLYLVPGVVFDTRSVVISVGALFGGPLVAGITFVVASAFRIGQGGAGTLMGVLVSFSSAAWGVAYYFWKSRNPRVMKATYLYGFGVVVHLNMLVCTLALPGQLTWQVLQAIALPVMFIYPVATLLLCLLMSDSETRMAADRRLKDSEEKFRTLFDHVADSIFIFDENTHFLEVNRTACQRLGYSREEMLGMSISQIDDAKSAGMVSQRMEALMTTGRIEMETVHVAKDGRLMPVEVNARLITLLGKPAVLGVARDITERRRAEQALRESELQFRTVVESAPVAIVIQTEGHVAYINEEGLKAFGAQSLDEVLGQPVLERVAPQCRQDVQERLRQVNQEKLNLPSHEFTYLRLDSSSFEVEVQSVPFAYQGSQGALVFFREITQRKQEEADKARLEAQLRQAQKMEAIGTLAGGIAHDFNNILGAIMGYGELALEAARCERPSQAHLEKVLHSAERARSLVRQILTFSRKSEADLRPLSLNNTVRQTMQLLEHSLPKMIAIETCLDPDLPLVSADPNQMEQVIMNLATNAADAMPEGGRLVLETQAVPLSEEYAAQHLEVRPGHYVLLLVSDTGQGIASNHLEHIFDPFFTTKGVGKGTGLGLATVYGIVKGHGGHVYCYSEVGIGTTFKIYLPVRQAEAPAPLQEPGPPPELLKGSETVLLVDDEEALRDLSSQSLEEMGYRVITAATGEEALEIYRGQGPQIDVVVMDLGMPGMGGHKCLKELLALDPKVKVVIASGYSANGQVKASLESGAKGYVAKPFRRLDLLATLRSVLDD